MFPSSGPCRAGGHGDVQFDRLLFEQAGRASSVRSDGRSASRRLWSSPCAPAIALYSCAACASIDCQLAVLLPSGWRRAACRRSPPELRGFACRVVGKAAPRAPEGRELAGDARGGGSSNALWACVSSFVCVVLGAERRVAACGARASRYSLRILVNAVALTPCPAGHPRRPARATRCAAVHWSRAPRPGGSSLRCRVRDVLPGDVNRLLVGEQCRKASSAAPAMWISTSSRLPSGFEVEDVKRAVRGSTGPSGQIRAGRTRGSGRRGRAPASGGPSRRVRSA